MRVSAVSHLSFFLFPEYIDGIRKERRDGIAIVRNKAQSRQRATRLYSEAHAKVPFEVLSTEILTFYNKCCKFYVA